MNYSRNTDGSYRTVTRTRYNAEGNPPVSAQKSLVSNLSDTSESKNLTIDERNLTSTQWEEYHNRTKRKTYNTLPTSNITAEAVSADGFTLRQTDNAGVTSTAGCPLDIQKDGTWYTYGWDLTKNICELYGTNGYIRTTYTYSPYGAVTVSSNSVYQPIQWSSEFHDDELALVYYNYRHYNPTDGRWLGRDLALKISKNNLYCYIFNKPWHIDYIGLADVLYFGKRLGIKSTRYNQPVSAALIEEMIKELLEDMKATKYAPDIIDAGVNLFFPSLMHSGVQYIAVIVYKCECKKKCLFGLFINKEIELPSWQMTIKPSDYKNDANVRGGFGTMHPAPTEKELTEFIMKRSEATTKRNEYKCKKGCKEA